MASDQPDPRELQAKIRELEREISRLRRGRLQTNAGDRTVTVPDEFWPLFEAAQATVNKYFDRFRADATRGTIEVADQRYVLVRASALSFDFLNTIRGLYADRGEEEAFAIGRNLLFDLAHVIGINDARNFHQKMNLTDPVARLSAGPVHFAYTGWAFVEILRDSNVSTDDDFCLHYNHPFSFEADSWIRAEKQAPVPVCIMNSGYSSGWCEESFGMPLTAVEVSCRARGEERCRFVMAPPERIQEQVDQLLEQQGVDVHRARHYEVPTFFERKRVEEEMARAREKAEESDRLKSQFLANMSHEIRTPLSAINACIELLEDERLEVRRREYLQTIRSSNSLLNNLISDILDLSKIEAGELHLDWKATNVADMLGQISRGYEAMRGRDERPVEFRVVREDGIAEIVELDPGRVQQVLNNLLVNAWKFTERGTIELSCRRAGGLLEFVVRDSGIGMTDEQTRTLFRPFLQADDGVGRRRGGVGLGLTIVKHLVEAMEGEIRVVSHPGEGTAFHVLFPYRPVTAPTSPGTEAGSERVAQESCRILLVEDNEVNRLLIKALLEKAGHTVIECSDGRQALDRLASGGDRIELVIMDVQMPGVDGLSAVREIRAGESGVGRLPVIALTAHAMKGDRELCLAAGFDLYLTKPVDRDRLLAAIGQLAPRG